MRTKITTEKEVLYDYREWLVSFVDTPDQEFRRYYGLLMDYLFTKPYRWVIEHDHDRYIDGIDLRKRYYDETEIDISGIIMDRCSVLECLVALFVRYSDTVLTEPGDISVAPELFFDALSHLNLLFFDDEKYDFRDVDNIIERFLECKFSLFGVSFGVKKQDLWLLTGKYSMEKW